jgi:hypothetical protein
MRIIAFICFFTGVLYGQTADLPFELERFDATYYQALVDNAPADANTEQALGLRYFNLYKLQRATQPSEYFPKPNKAQKEISAMLQANYPDGMAAAFVNFIESEGSFESCAQLVSRPDNFAAARAYRFLAAFVLSFEDIEKQTLLSMQSSGQLHPILLGYGKNMLHSSEDFDFILTNGLQDLVAVRSAQLIHGLHKENPVLNLLAQKCPGYTRPLFESVLEKQTQRIFVAPALSEKFLSTHQQNLWLSGIGYEYASGPNPNPEIPVSSLLQAARDFELTPVSSDGINPSLQGLAITYQVFAERLGTALDIAGTKDDKRRAKEIRTYTENILNP